MFRLFLYAGDELTGKVRANLGDILQFLTGLRVVPPLGMTKKIHIYFHYDSTKVLPEASACFNMLYLPRGVKSEEYFYDYFDKAVLFSLNHFGQE